MTGPPDLVFRTREAKYRKMLSIVEDAAKRRQPVLIEHHVLNAKEDEREAEMIGCAGAADMVTVATDMAGRGTDMRIFGATIRSEAEAGDRVIPAAAAF